MRVSVEETRQAIPVVGERSWRAGLSRRQASGQESQLLSCISDTEGTAGHIDHHTTDRVIDIMVELQNHSRVHLDRPTSRFGNSETQIANSETGETSAEYVGSQAEQRLSRSHQPLGDVEAARIPHSPNESYPPSS